MAKRPRPVIWLIDVENVHNHFASQLGKHRPKSGDCVYYCFTDNCMNLSVDAMGFLNSLPCQYEMLKCFSGQKNALDFQISTILGSLVERHGPSHAYRIMSNDTGYDPLCKFWKAKGVNVVRVTVDMHQALPQLIEHGGSLCNNGKIQDPDSAI